MCKMCVDAGACRMSATITADMDDSFRVVIGIDTNCPNINRIKGSLGSVDPFTEIGAGFAGSEVYRWASGLPHVACPVPCAIVKCVEVAGGLGVRKQVSMGFVDG